MRTSRRGFSLVETIAAVVILAIAVPTLMATLRAAHRQRVTPHHASVARWLAEARLEQVIADRHAEERGWDWIVDGNYPDESGADGRGGFDRTTSIVETGADLATPGAGYKRVTVAVTFMDGGGSTRTLTVATVVTEYQS